MARNNNGDVLPPPLLPNPPPPGGAPAQPRGGGGGNRRRGQRPRRNNAPAPQTAALRPGRQINDVPADRSDPLWSTGLVSDDLKPEPNTLYIYSGFEGLMSIVSVLHASYSASSVGYARVMTEAALAYYCACFCWYRAMYLCQGNGLRLSPDETAFIIQFCSLRLEAPALLAQYLSGFGNTRYPSGRDVRFRVPDRPAYVSTPRVRGWFGRVAAATQMWYSQYPCLAVFASRLVADVSTEDYSREWNFPTRVRPAEPGAGNPTSSLIGYGGRSRLSAAQRSFLESAGIVNGEAFPSVNGTFALNIDLLHAVQGELAAVRSLRLLPVSDSLAGSRAHLTLVEHVNEFAHMDPSVRLNCLFRLPTELIWPASAFRYRVMHAVDRLTDDSNVPWCIYTFEARFADRWAGYANEGNALRVMEPEMFGMVEFQSTPYLIISRLEAIERGLAIA